MTKQKKSIPPCGWDSWDCFGAGVTEQQIKDNADYMAKYLKQYGWEYVICDIQWYEPMATGNNYNNFFPLCMDEYGRLLPAENRFPSAANGKGFKPIADYCHSLGLKFGLHMMRGVPRQAVHANCQIKNSKSTCRDIAHHFSVCSWNTDMYGCQNIPASQEYYNSIFELYAEWGVDYIKCDDIAVTEFRKWDNPYSAYYEIEMIKNAINDCGREMFLSLSPGPAELGAAAHMRKYADSWRITGDFWDEWDKLYEMFDYCKAWQDEADGHWPDCDMLPLGILAKNGACHGAAGRNSNFTKDEQVTMMTLWGIFKSPLIFGGNLPENDAWTLNLLTNEEYMLMHRTASRGHEIYRKGKQHDETIAWMSHGIKKKYFAIFNTSDRPKNIHLDIRDYVMPKHIYPMYDLWEKEIIGGVQDFISVCVTAHGVRLLEIR